MGAKLGLPEDFKMETDQTKEPKIHMTYCGGWGYEKYFQAVRNYWLFFFKTFFLND